MDPLSITASIIAILQLSTKVLGYLNDFKDASREGVQCAIEITNLLNLLYKLKDLAENTDPAKPWHNAVRSLAVKKGPFDQLKEALELLYTRITEEGALKKVTNALVWKVKKGDIASILGRIERVKVLVEIALQMDHAELSQAIKNDTQVIRDDTQVIRDDTQVIKDDNQAIKDDTQAIKDDTQAIKSGISSIQMSSVNEEHRRLVEWISDTDYPAQHSDIIKLRHKGTGQWFLDTPEFAKWLGEPKGTLFCPGIPGGGKTIVAAIAIDHLLETAQNSSHGVAYLYFNYKAQKKQETSSMLAAILKQLVQARPSIAEPAEKLRRKHADRGTRPSLDELFNALRDVVACYPITYIVLDALDECQHGTRSQILANLRDLQAGRGDIRLMATSRYTSDIEGTFREAPKVEVQASKEDVERFVDGQIYRLPRCIQNDPTLQNIVQDRIVEAVDGMFLLAYLYIESLIDKRTTKGVKSTLAGFSQGSAPLDDAYRDALQRIQGQRDEDRKLAKKALSWITLAKRSLFTAEICGALAVEENTSKLDPEKIPDAEDLVSVCAGLVVNDVESGIIRLVHYTAQEYFESILSVWNPTAEVDIAETCLTFLSFSIFEASDWISRPDIKGRELKKLKGMGFVNYAGRYWGKHVAAVERDVRELACSFLLQENLILLSTDAPSRSRFSDKGSVKQDAQFPTWLHAAASFGLSIIAEEILRSEGQCKDDMFQRRDLEGRTPLYLAASHGHDKLTKLLLDKGANVNTQGGENGNAIQVASNGGHKQVVKLLVDRGANVNSQGGRFGSALQMAVYRSYEQIARFLIDKGADVNAQSENYPAALYEASAKGQTPLVGLLIDKGANLNAQDGFYGNALQVAVYRGHEHIARLLLEKGAEVNAQGGHLGTALQAASYGGYERIVKLLLEKGAEVNAQGGKFGTALQAASYGGLKAIVQLLVNNRARVNLQGGEYGNALQAASSEGHEQVVRLLVNAGAEVNAQGGKFPNALYPAAFKGYERIVRLLVDKGADDNFPGGFYGNSLQAASSRGHEQIVSLLLDKGANGPEQSERYNKALYAASEGGHEQIVQLLINKGADVNAQGGFYGDPALTHVEGSDLQHIRGLYICEGFSQRRQYPSALYAAVCMGHERVVRLLVDRGANVNFPGGDSNTILQVAILNRDEQIVKLLLSKGADVNIQYGQFGTALQAASYGGDKEIITLLVDKGANINAKGGRYGNALNAAFEEDHEHVVRLLVDKGANIDAQDGRHGNALQAASYKGYEQIVRLLIDKGANIDAQGGRYGNALQAALYEGHDQIARLLLDKGADVNAQDGKHGNALYAATIKGHEQIVKLLIDKGTNIDAQGGRYGNALQAASYGGHEQIVRLLVDEGVDVNAKGGEYGNALQAASYRGHEQIVRLLLDKGADVNAQGGEHSNALYAASVEGHEQIVKLLIDEGANIDAQGGRYGNALQAASYGGHEQIVRLLVDEGVDVNAKGGEYSYAFCAAFAGCHNDISYFLVLNGVDPIILYEFILQRQSWEGDEELVREIVEKLESIDINAQSKEYGNAIYAASKRGHEQIVRLLIDNGADVNAQCERHGYAIQAASSGGHEQIVRLLIDKGADVNAQGGKYGSALKAASCKGHEKIVKLLVDMGAT